MGNRIRKVAVMVTHSPIVSPEVLVCDNFGAKRSERVELRQRNRNQAIRVKALELEIEQANKRKRLMKAAILKHGVQTRVQKVFMGKREIAEKEAIIYGGNVKLIADKQGVHFNNKRIAVNDLKKEVSANLHGTSSAEFTFRDNVSGKVVGKTAIKTNKIW